MAQVPSPRQKVVPEALVPLLRFVTGRLPVTPVASDTFVIVLVAPLMEAPATMPVSSTVTALFCMILPVAPLKRAMALSVEEAGPVTSPEPPPPLITAATLRRLVVASACRGITVVPSASDTASKLVTLFSSRLALDIDILYHFI